MQNLIILNSKQIKEILFKLKEQFGFNSKLDYAFLKNNEGKIFLVNKDIAKIDLEKLNINNIGLYFGKIENNMIRLSIEGSQIIGKEASKNVLEINDEQTRSWMKGENIKVNSDLNGFIIVKNKDDVLGCGKISKGLLINFMPKERRIKKL